MKLTQRQGEILQCFNEYSEMTLKEFSGILNISSQTIRTELQNMKQALYSYGIYVEVSNGNQLQIRGRENLTHMLKATKGMMEFSMEKQTMLLLLLTDEFVVLQDIADELFISKSSMEKLMAALLKKYPDDLQSLRHYGIRCILPQMEKRLMFAKLMAVYFQGIDFRKEIVHFDALHFPLRRYFDENDIAVSIAGIEVLQKTKDITFTDESMCQLFLCLLFMVRHRRKNHSGHISDILAHMLRDLPRLDTYMEVARQIADVVNLNGDLKEIHYICYLLMTLRKQKIFDSHEIVAEMQELIREILDAIYQRLSVDLSNDEELFNGLAMHLYATVLRKDLLKPLSIDYSWNDIRHQYPLSFEMSVIVSARISKKYSYRVSADEMIYLTLHFQAAIERMKSSAPKIRTVVVCHYGMAAASLIETKINRLFSSLQVIGSYSMHNFLQLKEPNCELVLTTEKIPNCSVPVIYVTPALKESELKVIGDFVDSKCINKMLEMIVMESTILRVEGAFDIQSIIARAVERLKNIGCVTEEYFDSVMERENISSTDIGCVAIPHGNPDFVKETKLMIIQLKEPVLWKVSSVKYIFLFAISRQQFTNNFSLFSTFYKRLVKSNMKDGIKRFDAMEDQELKVNLAYLLGA